ncbi:uncharacterized protein LOC111079252 isoform X2 [Drosophila obscura]|uniref:uncharacterized protein LOC111079252 isoform X2 n=1 Tax=Drosophila obscura TaxID=7282 RepID=UPI001BB13B8F|nr:uncharacterized protein LOC111079252 isoform X2 [Drosophila obscura]
MLQLCTIYACANGTLGLNLSRAPWDPYPWVSGVQAKSNAERGGVRIGDTLLELNGVDILGLRISELAHRLAEHWHSGAECVTMMMWRQQAAITSPEDAEEASHAVHGINQQSLQKFATCLQHISQLLECPVCLEVIKPPGWQCCNGHVLCNNCRSRSVKCPVCRVPLGPRGRCLLSDKLFTLLAESFPCDGGKTNKVTTDQDQNQDQAPQVQRKLSSVNKCTNEYHNQPKMALAKSNSGKKCGKQISRQLQLDAVAVVVLNGRHSSGAGADGDGDGDGGNGGVLQQHQHQQMPKGNEENARIRNNVADNRNSNHNSNGNSNGNANGSITRRWHSQGQDEKDLQRCTLIKVQHQESRFNEQQKKSALEVLESNNMLVKPKLKLSRKSCRITGKDQDGLRCDEVANINTGQHPATGQKVEEEQLGQKQEQVMQSAGGKGQLQFQNYHCPTGKSCILSCSSSVALLKLSQPAAGSRNKLSSVIDGDATADAAALGAGVAAPVAAEIAAATLSVGSHKQAPASEVNQATSSLVSGSGSGSGASSSIKSCEWQLLRHLSTEHRLAVLHSYGTFGERLHVQLPSQQTVACLSLSEDVSLGHENVRVHTFFLAVIPISAGHGHAVFLWHLDRPQEEPHFETVIETQGGRVKWFGAAHSLRRSWPEIAATGHFLSCHNLPENACAAFDITVKRKYPQP